MLKVTEYVESTPEAPPFLVRGKLDSLEDFNKLREVKVDLHILLDLARGQDAISRRLPVRALSSLTIWLLFPKFSQAPWYRKLLRSLSDGVFTGEKKGFRTYVVGEVPLGKLGFSPAYVALEEVGTATSISYLPGNENSQYADILASHEVSLQQLQAMEAQAFQPA